MENQNNQHKKNHFQKAKPYFIEPPTQENGNTASSISVKEAKVAQQAQEGGKHSNHHNNRHNKDDAKSNERQQQKNSNEVAKNTPQKSQNEKANGQGAEQKPHKGHSKNNKHKNRPNNSPSQNEQKNVSVEKDNTSSNNSRKAHEKKPSAVAHTPNIDVSEYEQIRFPSASEEKTNTTVVVTEEKPAVTVEVVGIRFKSSGKTYYFAPNGKTLKRGECAIVETARGQEFGEVAMGNRQVNESDTVSPLRPVIRIATDADKQHHKENKAKEDEAFRICNEKIISHGLDMKLIDAQYTFDNSKLLFYFTSSGRVDFRDLVKDLASVFKTRIELRQIGIRDEAKIMGGVGMCGRPLCCTLFLSDFGQVSIKMAKEQNLSLNSAKISGICGRLMCCLRYEHETYEYEIKRTPPVDALVNTADGNGVVTEISPLAGTVKVRLTASPDTPPKTYKREDVVMLQKKQNKDSIDESDKK